MLLAAMSPQLGPLRQAAFFGPTVANGALRTSLDLQLSPPSRDCRVARSSHTSGAPRHGGVARFHGKLASLRAQLSPDLHIRRGTFFALRPEMKVRPFPGMLASIYVFGACVVAIILFVAVKEIEPNRRLALALKFLIVFVSVVAIAKRLMP